MKCSVILSTYNQPQLLAPVLTGYAAQTDLDFEILIADDGSGEETRRLIADYAATLPVPVRHVWHEDQGFRKCHILNASIEQAQGKYLVFSDGDCIPAPDFLAVHHHFAARQRFLSGGCLRLDEPTSLALRALIAARDAADATSLTDYARLKSVGLKASPGNWLRLASGPGVAAFADRLTTTRPSWNGHNASCWREDAIRVNGFDQRMGYGGEDREFGERLERIGVKGFQIRHRARCVHLFHQRGYVTREVWAVNDRIRAEHRAQHITWSAHGMRQGSA